MLVRDVKKWESTVNHLKCEVNEERRAKEDFQIKKELEKEVMYHKSEVETLRKEIAAEKGKMFWFGRTISDLQSKLEQYAWNIALGEDGRDKTLYVEGDLGKN